ncbi:MAG: DUF4167 domain-containing protein [Pseudomonadota bacterium]
MRPAQKSNRSRGRGNRKSGGGSGNNINRVYDSAGPEGKVRGTPQQIIDKYLSLARDAQTSGDRVASENFLQHAEHYQRILIQAAQSQEQARREAQENGAHQAAEPAPDPGAAEQPVIEDPGVAKPAAEPEPAAAISGMTMIDAAAPDTGLLVDGDDIAKSQPKRNGDGRSRRPRKPKETADTAAPDTVTPAAETTGGEQPASAEQDTQTAT